MKIKKTFNFSLHNWLRRLSFILPRPLLLMLVLGQAVTGGLHVHAVEANKLRLPDAPLLGTTELNHRSFARVICADHIALFDRLDPNCSNLHVNQTFNANYSLSNAALLIIPKVPGDGVSTLSQSET